MKKITNKLILPVLAAVALSGCIKETMPTNGASAGQVGASSAALTAMVNSIPTGMILYAVNFNEAWDFGYPAIMISLNAMSGDMVIGGENGYNWFQNWHGNLYLSEEYVTGYQFWYNYYSWIKSCNDVISSLSAVPAESWNDEQRAFCGIAKTYRALYYLDLVRLFEPKVPTSDKVHDYVVSDAIKGLACTIVTENTSESDAANNPRATVADVYDQVIFPDLEEAAELLDGYQPAAKTMPTKAVVYGLMARAYLERGTAGVDGAYAKAAEYARMAITESGCTPLTQAQWEDPITGFNSSTANGAWMFCTNQTSDQVHNLYSFIAHMSIEENWTNYGKAVGRSINSHLYEKIADDDFRKHSWLDPDFFDYYDYKSCRPDARTFFCDVYPGTSYTKEYGSIKFRPGQGDYETYSIGNAIDFPLMRVEEMYLIEAEATGAANLENGKALLNTFMQTYRQPSYNCTASSFADFQKEVALQARIEFWGEGIPFFYKKRLGLGIHLANSNCKHDDYRFELDGVAPWWNIVIPKFERLGNTAITPELNNPDPTETVDPIFE